MKHDHFSDERIDDIRSGCVPLTPEERIFLILDTPRHEECELTESELAALSDADLMSAAYRVWADYVRGMF